MTSTSKLVMSLVMLVFIYLCLAKGSRGGCVQDCAVWCMGASQLYICVQDCMRRCEAGDPPHSSALDDCNLGCVATKCLGAKKSSDAMEVQGCLASCSKTCLGNRERPN